jgi:hypothetical protein
MTQPDAAVPDFTIKRDPHQFRIDEDVFSAPAFLAPFTLKQLAVEAGSLGDLNRLTDVDSVIQAIDTTTAVMAAFMPGESGQRFKARLESQGRPERQDPETGEMLPADPKPIDLMQQAIPALYYLMECYGLRPTKPSSTSPDGSMDGQTNALSDGTSSTAGPSLPASTSDDSTPPAGSI